MATNDGGHEPRSYGDMVMGEYLKGLAEIAKEHPSKIEQLEALERAATAGPWRWSDNFKTRDNDETWSLLGGSGYGILSCDGFGNSPQMCNKHDAELIVEMRAALGNLLAVAKAAKLVKAANARRANAQVQDCCVRVDYEQSMGYACDQLTLALERLEAQ